MDEFEMMCFDEEEIFTCDYCDETVDGEDGLYAHEYECPNQEFHWLKGYGCPHNIEDPNNLDILIESLDALVQHLIEKKEQGWITTMMDNGYVHIAKPKG